jgi:hypothetical protein
MYLYLYSFSIESQGSRNQRESTYFSHARNSTCSHSFFTKEGIEKNRGWKPLLPVVDGVLRQAQHERVRVWWRLGQKDIVLLF